MAIQITDQMIIRNGLAVSILKADGKQLFSNNPPPFSFQYSELNFTKSAQVYMFNGKVSEMTPAEIAEVSDYLSTVQETDGLSEKIQSNIKNQAYLASTDWYVTRFAETGKEIPQDILDARAAARLAIYAI